jgi:hypothetical protein
MRSKTARTVAACSAAVVVAGAAAAYPALLRRRILTWGSTREEADREMPGDNLVPFPDLISTRAVTVAAPPDVIWPWLVQMGLGRGGVYSYDWINNLIGFQMHSASELLPDAQNLHVGDVLPHGTRGPSLRVQILEPDRALVLLADGGNWTWAFALYPGAMVTRLVSRNRLSFPVASAFTRTVILLAMEPGSLIMERKMLLGIKARAERHAQPGDGDALPAGRERP